MALYFNGNIPKKISFNGTLLKKLIFNNIIVWEELPSEYTEVEYIESNGYQYIDTEIYGTEKTRIDITYEYNQDTTSGIIFGNRIANKNKEFLLGTETNLPNYLFLGYANSGISKNSDNYVQYNIPINTSTKYRVIINPGLYSSNFLKPSLSLKVRKIYTSIKVNEDTFVVENINTNIPFTTFKTLDIFGGYTSQNNFELTSAKLYKLKIYNENTLQRDFVPCYRESDGEIGLYDMVSRRFFTNAGTGTFRKGNNIN